MPNSARMTPGPWRVGDAGCTVFGPKRQDGGLPKTIAKISGAPLPGYEAFANAQAIAALPELIKAVKDLMACSWAEEPFDTEQADAVRRILARIDGERP